MEGPELLRKFPGVDWRFQKMAFEGDDEEINAETYGRAASNIEVASHTLIPRKSDQTSNNRAYLDVIGMACTSISFVIGRERVWDSLINGQGSSGDLVVTDMATSQLRAIAAVGG